MKVLVTGGTGFIGSHLVDALRRRGDEVKTLGRYHGDSTADYRADVRDRAALEEIKFDFEPELVYHLAAFHHVGRSWEAMETCYSTNVLGSVNVMEVFGRPDERTGSAKVVYMSSSEVYGDQDSVPWQEDMLPRPRSPYAVSKLAGEHHARMLHDADSPVMIVRGFNVYGPGQSMGALIGELVRGALRGEIHTTPGRQTRDWVYVNDMVEALLLAGQRIWSGPVNIGTGRDISVREVSEMIVEAVGAPVKVCRDLDARVNEIWRMQASTERARQVLEWEATTSLAEGIERTIEWHRKRREK